MTDLIHHNFRNKQKQHDNDHLTTTNINTMKIITSLLIVATLFDSSLSFQLPLLAATTKSAKTISPYRNTHLHAYNEQKQSNNSSSSSHLLQKSTAILSLATILTTLPLNSNPAMAVSGGGLDYANLNISDQDFSQQNYKGKDFSQVIAKATSFKGSNLIGCRFFKAYLVKADFTDADIRGASLEDTSMDEAVLTGANAAGAYFSASLLDAASIENVDFSDASIPPKTLQNICNKPDFAKGTNPQTGIETRDSLFCP